MRAKIIYVALAVILLSLFSSQAQSQERLCDTAFEDCREPLWRLIDHETDGIDVAFWFMQDTSISNKIIADSRPEFRCVCSWIRGRIRLTPATKTCSIC